MDKWIVNNYIVQMRHSVTQARVHVLNKLVREIRKLQKKKGTDEQKEKNCRKAERIKKEVIFMKKLDPDELSKYALLFTADPSEMLNKVSLSIEERAKVRLAGHKSVAQQVEIFRAKYPEWELKLSPLLVQLGLQKKYKKNESVSQESNSEPVTSNVSKIKKPKEKSVTENNTMMEGSRSVPACSNVTNDEKSKGKIETENKIVKENTISELDISSVKRSNVNIKEGSENENEEEVKRTESSDESIESESDDNVSDTENEAQKKLQEVKNKTNISSEKCERKKNGIAEVRRFADLLESDGNSENEHGVEDENPNPTNSVTDPFFLTGDDSGESGEELSSSEEEQEEGEEETKSTFSGRDRFFIESKDKRPERINVREKGRNWKFEKKSTSGQRYFKGDQKVPTMNRKQRRMMEKAKSEMKKGSTFSQFSSTISKHNGSSAKQKFLPNPVQANFMTGSSADKQETLHPSWEAKRRQREILPFQGKKIKFDDDGD